jgi:hypothetical protein
MAEKTKETKKYTPEVIVDVENEATQEEVSIHIPVPDEQKWLYAMLEEQQKSIRKILSWMTFFGIVTIVSMIAAVWYLISNL